MPERAFIELGSNISPEHYLPEAVIRLNSLGRIIACSKPYQNAAIATEAQDDYINAAVLIETSLPPLELRDALRSIEGSLGRRRTDDRDAPRTIDLDIALYGQMIIDHPLLHIPDKHIYERPYLALTLAECDPEFTHPQTGESLSTIAGRLEGSARLKPREDLELTRPDDLPLPGVMP